MSLAEESGTFCCSLSHCQWGGQPSLTTRHVSRMDFHGFGCGGGGKGEGVQHGKAGGHLLAEPQKGTCRCSLLSKTLSVLLGLSKLWAMLESCSQGMQVARPNPAPLLPANGHWLHLSISIYIQDLAGLVGDVKSPDTLPYFSTPGLRAELASLQGWLPT